LRSDCDGEYYPCGEYFFSMIRILLKLFLEDLISCRKLQRWGLTGNSNLISGFLCFFSAFLSLLNFFSIQNYLPSSAS